MNRIERLTAILLLLQDKPHTSKEIAHQFEVSKRTVLRDIQALSEMGVPIVAREGAGGGYSLPAEYLPAPLPLTTNEAFLLLLALSSVTRLSDIPFAGERASLMAKLRALLPQQLSGVEQMLAAVGINVPERQERAPFLEPLITATQQRRWVQVTYQSAERLSEQHLFPHQIFLEEGYWYCRAYSHERQEERTYRVDRIRSITSPGEGFQEPPSAQSLPYQHESHPLVRAELTARGVAWVQRDPHLARQVVRNPDGTGSLSFHCPPDELGWFSRYFAGLGEDVVVIAPPELCQRLKQLGQRLVDRY